MLLRLIEWLEVAFRVESVPEVQSACPSSSGILCGEIMDNNVMSHHLLYSWLQNVRIY